MILLGCDHLEFCTGNTIHYYKIFLFVMTEGMARRERSEEKRCYFVFYLHVKKGLMTLNCL